MKRLGFTLAEVLVTLGIIGIVAALTAPAIVQNAGSAQVGPKLAKAVTTFELANQNLLNATDSPYLTASSALTGEEWPDKTLHYVQDELPKYMKISLYEDESGYDEAVKAYDGSDLPNIPLAGIDIDGALRTLALSKDGFLFAINLTAPLPTQNATISEWPLSARAMGLVLIDINGLSKPNRLGHDIFVFQMYNDGTLKPAGSSRWYTPSNARNVDNFNAQYNWRDGTTDQCNETTITSGLTCAGSVYENNLKVIYEQ